MQPTAHATTQAKKPAPPESKEDPQHPLRGGGLRKRVFAKRPSRVPGSSAWLERQIDRPQRYTLRVAFVLYESSEKRLELCKRFRMTGQQHKHLPLRSMSSKPVCSDSVCSCKPDYIDLVGRAGGMGTGEPDFVRAAARASSRARACAWSCFMRSRALHPPGPTRCAVSSRHGAGRRSRRRGSRRLQPLAPRPLPPRLARRPGRQLPISVSPIPTAAPMTESTDRTMTTGRTATSLLQRLARLECHTRKWNERSGDAAPRGLTAESEYIGSQSSLCLGLG